MCDKQMLIDPLDPPDFVIGVDEAGRGPLAGSVVAAAVMLDPHSPVPGLDDSKRLSEKRRESLFIEIQQKALGFAIAQASCAEIDEINILQASLLAMHRAVNKLVGSCSQAAPMVLVDGNRCPAWSYPSQPVVGGDRLVASIAAASILAKVSRDRQMLALEQQFPDYGFARHKGYPTREHLEALQRLGPCPEHRRSFGPVRNCLARLE